MSNENYTIVDGVIRALGQDTLKRGFWCEVGVSPDKPRDADHRMMVRLWWSDGAGADRHSEVDRLQVDSWGEGYDTAIFVLHGLENGQDVVPFERERKVDVTYEKDEKGRKVRVKPHHKSRTPTSQKLATDLTPCFKRFYQDVGDIDRLRVFDRQRLYIFDGDGYDVVVEGIHVDESRRFYKLYISKEHLGRLDSIVVESKETAIKMADWILETVDEEVVYNIAQ